MSNTNIINFLLDLKDTNLVINENLPPEFITLSNGVTAKLLHLKTTTKSISCPHCGQSISKLHDYRTVRIKHYICGKQPLILSIRKKRLLCLDCMRKVTEKLPFVKANCFISDELKKSIIFALTQIGSLKSIALDHNVSHTTVYTSLNKVPSIKHLKSLPSVLSFDEFRANTSDGKYAFMMVDPISKRIVDILPNRQFAKVFSSLSKFKRKERNKVKFIIIDLWKPYAKIISKLFPKATIVADKFHYQRLVNRSLHEVRKRVCSKLDSKVAFQIKKNWRLLSKSYDKLDDSNRKYSYLLKRSATDFEVLNHILSLDAQLKEVHNFYQDFLHLINLNDINLQEKLFRKWIDTAKSSDIKELQSNAKTFKEWFDPICASFKDFEGHKLSNAFIEGTNNKIKVIKRVSFGYRSFLNFRKRILLICS